MDLQDVKSQLDRIETKLDTYAKAIATNAADLVWVKGTVKVGNALLITTCLSAIGWLISH